MMSLKKAMLIHLKNRRTVDWEDYSVEYISQIVAYNAALQDTLVFMTNYEKGEINQEYLEALDKPQRGE